MVPKTFASKKMLKQRPESGVDSLICAELSRERTSPDARDRSTHEWSGQTWNCTEPSPPPVASAPSLFGGLKVEG